jgi:hypothetical protein
MEKSLEPPALPGFWRAIQKKAGGTVKNLLKSLAQNFE